MRSVSWTQTIEARKIRKNVARDYSTGNNIILRERTEFLDTVDSTRSIIVHSFKSFDWSPVTWNLWITIIYEMKMVIGKEK